jgi:transposase
MMPSSTRILVCTQPQDMRRSFDALALVARELLGEDPQSGALYVFVSRSATRVKVLWWDRHGYCLLYKRLHRALFVLPREAPKVGEAMQLEAAALAELLAGVERRAKADAPALH